MRIIKSVFLARTPLQFLISKEALVHFEIKPEESVLILFTDFKPSLEQIHSNLLPSDWGIIHRLFRAVKSKRDFAVILFKFSALLRLFFLTRKYQTIDTLFVGHIDDVWMRYFIKRVKSRQTILLEDGVATLRIASRRVQSNCDGYFPLHPQTRKRGFFRNDIFESFILGQQQVIIKTLTLFTVYNHLELNRADRVVENKFDYLRKQKKTKQIRKKEVWFIGQPLVERGHLTKAKLLQLLEKVKKKWGNEYVYYFITHRSGQIPAYLNEFGFQCLSFTDPIEIVIASSPDIPEVIGSVNSAALVNIYKLLQDEEVKIFYSRLSDDFYLKNTDSLKILEYFEKNTKMLCISI